MTVLLDISISFSHFLCISLGGFEFRADSFSTEISIIQIGDGSEGKPFSIKTSSTLSPNYQLLTRSVNIVTVDLWQTKMKTFIVVSCMVLAVMAKPQGYNYNPPSPGLNLALLPPNPISAVQFSTVQVSNAIVVLRRWLLICSFAVSLDEYENIAWWHSL